MRVLVACEFRSCDLLPSERAGNHYRGDVRDIIDGDWDLMIAHPPCTHCIPESRQMEGTFPYFDRYSEGHFGTVGLGW